MKKLIFLVLILCLFSSLAFAQSKSDKKSDRSKKIKLICSNEPMSGTGVGYGSGTNREETAPQFDTPVKIISKPKAPWTNAAIRAAQLQGIVILRIQFLSNCEIGQIQVVKGMPFGLSESSIEAARKIVFQPALKDGKPISVRNQIEYPFSIYY